MVSITSDKEKVNSICKKNNMKIITKELNQLMPSLNTCPNLVCPKCGATGSMQSHSSYERNLLVLSDFKIFPVSIRIHRVICSKCHSTHALLPDFIVPFKQYSSQSIIDIAIFAFRNSIEKAAIKFDISTRQVYRFVKLLNLMLNYVVSFLLSLIPYLFSSSPDITIFNNLPSNFSEVFFNSLKSPFLYISNKRKLYIGFHKLSI